MSYAPMNVELTHDQIRHLLQGISIPPQPQIMVAAWEQPAPRRLLVHLVNHDYDRGLRPRNHVTVTLPLATPPRSVSEASPDLPQDRPLDHSHADGRLTVTLPQLTAYSVISVEL